MLSHNHITSLVDLMNDIVRNKWITSR